MATRVRGFHQLSRAWYRDAVMQDGCDDFHVGAYFREPDEGTDGEFVIEQVNLGQHGRRDLAWRLGVFSESWRLLASEFADVIALLGALGEKATGDQIREGLLALGLVDLTVTTRQ